LLGTPGERGISGREKLEVVEVCTGQAQRPHAAFTSTVNRSPAPRIWSWSASLTN
jgi:hypothetical protein